MATLKQDRMYARLRLSSQFSADEVAGWDAMMADSQTLVEQATDLIDTMLLIVDYGKQRKHDAAQRKAEYYAKKGA